MTRLLEGKTILITGAGRGIGAAAARHFANEGARTVLASRTREQLDEVAAEITKAGGVTTVFVADVSRVEDHVASSATRLQDLADSMGLRLRWPLRRGTERCDCVNWGSGCSELFGVKYRADLRACWATLRPKFIAARDVAFAVGEWFRLATERGIR